ncbi:MAG TPA: ribosome maturation factor RimM [Streptosporangiaceae bacterium]|nr:ribosome maturation factor RimM [Streptosporangiaceae bacterium]
MQVVVGQVGRPHGVRGEVVVHVRTDDPGVRFAPGSTLAVGPGGSTLTVAASRWQSGRLVVAFEGLTDRTSAGRLRGALLTVDSAGIPPSDDPDEFYDHELINMEVVTTGGQRVGTVTDVFHHGQDLLVVQPPDPAADEILVPFVRAIVPDVDRAAGRIVIDPPPGLLDPGEAPEA